MGKFWLLDEFCKRGFYYFFFPKWECFEDSSPTWTGQKENLPCAYIGRARQQAVRARLVAIAFFSLFYLICIVFIPCLVGTAPILISDCLDWSALSLFLLSFCSWHTSVRQLGVLTPLRPLCSHREIWRAWKVCVDNCLFPSKCRISNNTILGILKWCTRHKGCEATWMFLCCSLALYLCL